jgi:hypothetical protein
MCYKHFAQQFDAHQFLLEIDGIAVLVMLLLQEQERLGEELTMLLELAILVG